VARRVKTQEGASGMYHDVVIAGFGGQGVLFMGNLLAEAGMEEGFHVTFMPAYGVEMRGGTANCNVIVSSQEVGSPITDSPLSGIIMNEASLIRFLPSIRKDGFLFYNSSLIPEEAISRSDIQVVPVPANDLAQKVGNAQVASLVILGCFVEWTQVLPREAFPHALEEMISPKAREKFLPLNLAALEEGMAYARELKGKDAQAKAANPS
jgi:2-oxoglutarate ferredoxin oxidoreductase subunit gamma